MQIYFFELGIILIVVSLIGLLFKFIKQPLILAYIATGFLLGPLFFKMVASKELVTTFSTIGITFLLFLVGLELDLRKLKSIGKPSLFASLGHFIIAGTLGFFLALGFGFPIIPSLYISLALVLSSTVIVVKLLSEKHDLNSLYGKISLGFLVIQDIFAITALIFLDALRVEETFSILPFFIIFLKAIVLVAVTFFVSTYVLPHVFRFISKFQELLFVLSIAWCFSIAIVSFYLGLSIEIGAFLAGLSLGYLPYSFEIVARVKSLRDFFLIMFFVALGTQITLGASSAIVPIVVFSLFILLAHPIIVMIILGLLGYSKRTSFLTGISIAQVSEFSLVILGTGYAMGHISQELVSIITIVAIITITISTYFITFGSKIYNILKDYLSIFERKSLTEHYTPMEVKIKDHVILVGCHVMGSRITETLLAMKKKLLIVDFDPDIICNLNNRKIPCIYGDIEDSDIIDRIGMDKASMIISTIPGLKDNLLLIHKAKKLNPKINILVATGETSEAFDLYKAGADYVILPFVLGGEHSSLVIRKLDRDKNSLKKLKDHHIKDLKRNNAIYTFF